MIQDELHPRPQLTRSRWTNLNGPWSFAYDDADVGLREGWLSQAEVFDRTITVPFPPESQASGIADPGFHPVVWYRRTFRVSPEDLGGRLLLHFGAVDYRAQVWVNGQFITHHEGGHTPFSADITAALRSGDAEQQVVVRAEDRPDDLAQPRGKQDWRREPHSIFYKRTTGIWQTVWLEPVPERYLWELRWTPDLDRGLLGLRVRLNTPPERPLRLRVQLSLRGTVLADDLYTLAKQETHRELALGTGDNMMESGQLLWSPTRPNLVDVTLTLLDGDEVIDEVGSYVGLRSASVQDGRFILNGRPTYLRLVLGQGYWPESHLAAPSEAALRREVELIKELGFNGVRVHQKVEDPRFLYWCDRLGLLVWGEMANSFVFSEESAERLTREWLEVLRRDYSHPCIVTWVPLNESWGVPNLERDPAQRDFVRGLYHLTKALDPTRPVIGNDGWEHFAADLWGIHDYAFDGETLRGRYATPEAVEHTLETVQPHHRNIAIGGGRHAGEPLMLTEFGGISLRPNSGERWWGYGTVENAQSFLAKYEELMFAVLDCAPIAGFCYTQLTDTEQETNGLLRADRTPKLEPAVIRAITTRVSKAVPGDVINEIRKATEISTFQEGS